MKERCIFEAGLDCCSRCYELERQCTTDRPKRAAGRRARSRRLVQVQSPPLSGASIVVSKVLENDVPMPKDNDEWRINAIIQSGSFEPFEEQLIRMLQPDREADLLRYSRLFASCPRFERDLARRLRELLDCRVDGHIDGYLACMGAVALKLGFIHDDGDMSDSNIRRGAVAVAKLRASHGPSEGHLLESWITLGLTIVTFALTALGTGATTVRQHILKHLASLPELPNRVLYLDPLVPMLILECWECLLKREVPLIKLGVTKGHVPVDRLFGLGIPLLVEYHDLCQISRDLANTNDLKKPEKEALVCDLRRRLEEWQPCPPPDFLNDYTTIEVVLLLCQAEVHRKAGLLFLHRLIHPFGDEDERGERLGREIMSEIRRANIITGSRVIRVALPFLLAGVNAQSAGLRADIKAQVHDHVDPACPLLSRQCEAFLSALWQVRDVSTGFFWLDLVKHLPDITLPI